MQPDKQDPHTPAQDVQSQDTGSKARRQTLISLLGPVRILLLVVVALCVLLAPFSDARPVGWGLVPAYLAPVTVMLCLFILLLDMLMNRVFMIEQSAERQTGHRRIIRTELLALVIMLLAWGPFFYALLQL